MKGKIGALVAAVAAAAGAVGATAWTKRRKDEGDLDLEVADDSGAVEQPAVAAKAEASDGADDLTTLKGLGAVTAGKLADAGVTTFAQIADWTDEDIAQMGLKINVSPGRIKREDWVGQARATLEG